MLFRSENAKAYRLASIEALVEQPTAEEKQKLGAQRLRLEALMAAAAERAGGEPRFAAAVPDEDLINGLSQYLELDPLERQALLERHGPLSRCQGLIELMEIRRLSGGSAWTGRSVH